MSSSPYIDRREAAGSYRPKAGTMSPGLQRAREPYRVKNAILGLALGAFAVGIWAYSISAVKQDVFDDVDEEVAALSGAKNVTGGSQAASSGADTNSNASGVQGTPSFSTTMTITSPTTLVDRGTSAKDMARGVLSPLENHLPGWFKLLDPEKGTLVWGAPPVDNVGKMGDRS